MNKTQLQYPLTTPERGSYCEVADGVLWIRMPLPYRLDHVNLWALRDQDGWAIVDTGVNTEQCKDVWGELFKTALEGKPVTRVICTHRHLDHIGLAGWLVEQFECELWITAQEFEDCSALVTEGRSKLADELAFYRRAGWTDSALKTFDDGFGGLAKRISPLPTTCRPIHDGEQIRIGSGQWQVVVCGGHTSAHACLFNADAGLLISGDQVLPRITSNVSVFARQPDADPMSDWFASMIRIKRLAGGRTLVLPSHNDCFIGLHKRIDSMMDAQHRLLSDLTDLLETPKRVVDVFPCLFKREIGMDDNMLLTMATGEAVANLNYLLCSGRIAVNSDSLVTNWYQALR